jgi:hypothetical protein
MTEKQPGDAPVSTGMRSTYRCDGTSEVPALPRGCAEDAVFPDVARNRRRACGRNGQRGSTIIS